MPKSLCVCIVVLVIWFSPRVTKDHCPDFVLQLFSPAIYPSRIRRHIELAILYAEWRSATGMMERSLLRGRKWHSGVILQWNTFTFSATIAICLFFFKIERKIFWHFLHTEVCKDARQHFHSRKREIQDSTRLYGAIYASNFFSRTIISRAIKCLTNLSYIRC